MMEPVANSEKASGTPATGSGPLPPLRTELTLAQVRERCLAASRRGRLAGYKVGSGDEAFRVECPGTPFEGWLVARAVATGAEGKVTLEFSTVLKPVWTWGFAVALVLSIWPGVVLTEGLVASLIPGSFWQWTWYWYMPLTVPFAPLAQWQAVKLSRVGVRAEAEATIEKLRKELGAVG